MTMTKDPLEKAKQTLERLQEQNTTLQKQIQAGSVLEAEYEKLVDKQTKIANRYDKLLMRVGDKHSKAHRKHGTRHYDSSKWSEPRWNAQREPGRRRHGQSFWRRQQSVHRDGPV